MPKIVDHEQRRDEIVHATMRVIGRVGLESTTVRAIAEEAGVSNGILVHYFANKQQIIVGAHRAAFAAVMERIEAGGRQFEDPVERLRAALQEAAPLDDERILEAHIDVSFWGHAMRDPELRKVRTQSHLDMQASWVSVFADVRSKLNLSDAYSDEMWAEDALILIDGLSAQALLFPAQMTPENQLAAIERFIGRVLSSANTG